MMFRRTHVTVIAALIALAPFASKAVAQDNPPEASTLPALTITAFPGSVAPETVTREMLGQEVALTGKIARVVPSERENVPFQLFLVDREEAPVMIVYWADAAKQIHGDRGVPIAGTPVSVTGTLEEYRGSLQVRVRRPEQIRIAGYGATSAAPPAAEESSAAQPNEQGYFTVDKLPGMRAYLGRELSISGKATAFRAAWSETAPHVITVSEGEHTMEVVFWPGPGEAYPDFSKAGTPIFATGQFQQYRDKLQLKVDDLANLSSEPLPAARIILPVLEPAEGRTVADGWPGRVPGNDHLKVELVDLPTGDRVSLRSLGPEHVGNTVSVSGTVGAVMSGGGSRAILIGDGRGFLRVNLPAHHSPVPVDGDQITILGKVVFSETRSTTEVDLISKED